MGLVAARHRDAVASELASARPGVRRRHRLRRPRQCRGQRQRGRAVRLPVGVGHLPGQRHGRPRAVPVGQTRTGQRAHPAGGGRRPHPHPDPDRLLAAGRIGRHGNRSRRGRRRRHRAVPAVRPAAAGRRHHHRRGVAAAARRAEPPRPTDVRAGDQRPAADHRDRIPHQPVRRAAAARATSPTGWCRASRAPRACCWPPRCWARR